MILLVTSKRTIWNDLKNIKWLDHGDLLDVERDLKLEREKTSSNKFVFTFIKLVDKLGHNYSIQVESGNSFGSIFSILFYLSKYYENFC